MKLKNKQTICIFIRAVTLSACLLAVGNFAPASANTQQEISRKVKNFYGWYIGQMSNDKDPWKNRTQIRNHTSQRLWNWLNSKAYREYGADYFLDAQDFARDWGTNITVSNFKMKDSVATFNMKMGRAKFKQGALGPHTIKLKLVKESGSWKIDRVGDN